MVGAGIFCNMCHAGLFIVKTILAKDVSHLSSCSISSRFAVQYRRAEKAALHPEFRRNAAIIVKAERSSELKDEATSENQ